MVASLGAPFAISKAKHIRAILLAMEYNATQENAGGMRVLATNSLANVIGKGIQFRELFQTLSRIITLKNQRLNEKSLIVMITKPPEPTQNERTGFDPDLLRNATVERIHLLAKGRIEVLKGDLIRLIEEEGRFNPIRIILIL